MLLPQTRLDRQLKELVEPDCCTRDLDLSQRGLGHEAFWAIAVAIAHNYSVFRLDLRRNRPELRGIKVRAPSPEACCFSPESCMPLACPARGVLGDSGGHRAQLNCLPAGPEPRGIKVPPPSPAARCLVPNWVAGGGGG